MAWEDISVQRQPLPTLGSRMHRWAWARLLGGLLLSIALVATAAPVMAAEGPAADLSRLQAGAALFEAHCVGCHIQGGNVIRRGKTLKLPALEKAGLADPEAIARIAAEGVGQMSGYGAVLGEESAAEVAEWIWLQALAGWPRTPVSEPLP
jgi:cytochrome c6